MMTMGEWNDAKMDGLISKIMTNWRPIGGPTVRPFFSFIFKMEDYMI